MRAALLHLKKADPVLAKIIKQVGPYNLAVRQPTIETLARSIVYQQISGKAAASVLAKLKAAVGPRFTAAALLRLTPEQMRACGLSAQKITYLRDLADKVASRQISFANSTASPTRKLSIT